MSASIASTFTPLSLLTLPDKQALCDEFVGREITSLRTPALVIDRSIFKRNCERVTGEATKRGMKFRSHVKSESDPRCEAKPVQPTNAQKGSGYKYKLMVVFDPLYALPCRNSGR